MNPRSFWAFSLLWILMQHPGYSDLEATMDLDSRVAGRDPVPMVGEIDRKSIDDTVLHSIDLP